MGHRPPKTAVVLDYTKLLALRKKAECDQDPGALATQYMAWSAFDSKLAAHNWPNNEKIIWKRIVNVELAKAGVTKVQANPDALKKSM